MRARHLSVAVVLAALLGSAAGAGARPRSQAACTPAPIVFGTPVRLGGPLGEGYEPGVEVDSAGTLYVTAHKASLIAEVDGGPLGARGASWLFRSNDGGRTFVAMDGLMGATRQSYAFEGDFAVDAEDRLYFADLTLADNHFYRYSNHGETLDFYRPLLGSVEGDDRPWLAARGDGVVFYLSNARMRGDGNVVLHRSDDGGQTFDPVGHTFPGSGVGHVAADPNSDHVYVATSDWLFVPDDGSATEKALTMWVSPDGGTTWRSQKVYDYVTGDDSVSNNSGFLSVAVSPADGSVYFVESDADKQRLILGRSYDHGATWTVSDVAPFAGTFATPWVAVSPRGDVGMIVDADPASDAILPGTESNIFAILWRPEGSIYAKVHPNATNTFGPGQVDFFQLAFAPDGAIVTAYSDFTESSLGSSGGPMYFARQIAGPNLGGGGFCPNAPPAPTATAPVAGPPSARRPAATELRLSGTRWRGRRLSVRALVAPHGATGSAHVTVTAGRARLRRRVSVRDNVVAARFRMPARARRARLTIAFDGGPRFRPATLRAAIRRR